MLRPDPRKKSPSRLGSDRTGENKVVTISLATRHERGKIQPPRDSAPQTIWPKPDHPFVDQLRVEPHFVWWRMMASVCPAESQLSCEVPQ